MGHQALSRRARSSPRCKAVSGVFSIVRKRPSALTLRRGRVVDADMRNLSFVHHVPSNSEEHEKDSDDDPNIDARHEGMKRRSKLIGKAFCCCEVTVGFSRNGRGNRTPRPELRRCGRPFVRIPQATWPRFGGAFSLAFLGVEMETSVSFISKRTGFTNLHGSPSICRSRISSTYWATSIKQKRASLVRRKRRF